jgi:pyroglutamyl-peptidase
VYHEPIRVTYERVVELVPKLLTPASPLCPQPDIVLHIGLAAGRKFFALEQGSSGQGYDKIPDVDGKRFPNSSMEAKFPPSEFPDALNTSFDTSDVVARWKKELGYSSAEGNAEIEGLPDVQLSFDAGNFLCGFIYYNSLAHYFSIKEDERPVAFMHVPDLSYSDEKTQEGQEVAIALIKALVESRRKHGVVRQSQETISDESPVDKMDNNFA